MPQGQVKRRLAVVLSFQLTLYTLPTAVLVMGHTTQHTASVRSIAIFLLRVQTVFMLITVRFCLTRYALITQFVVNDFGRTVLALL